MTKRSSEEVTRLYEAAKALHENGSSIKLACRQVDLATSVYSKRQARDKAKKGARRGRPPARTLDEVEDRVTKALTPYRRPKTFTPMIEIPLREQTNTVAIIICQPNQINEVLRGMK